MKMRIGRRVVVPRAMVLGNRVRINAQHLGDQQPLGNVKVNPPQIAALSLVWDLNLGATHNHRSWVPCGDYSQSFRMSPVTAARKIALSSQPAMI